ncbi:MAG: cobalamin biosynthesis protein [Candidatus Verstraetearchaeota archaeon]|nr:cobalamin biosynthesis protein [Candidatus Verstraetearchaeota archaeon]
MILEPTLEPVLILALALAIDIALGEPPMQVHLTVWIGKWIGGLEPVFRRVTKNERLGGSLLALSAIVAFTLLGALVYLVSSLSWHLYILLSAFLLKMTFALRCMFGHVVPIAKSLDSDIDSSRRRLSLVVRRDTSVLDKRLIASGAVETVAEGFVDGFISPLFFYTLFGLPGAVAYRVINTLDSMVGYRDERYIRFGWLSAKLDSIANYIPSRLTSLIFAAAASFLRLDWRGAMRVCRAYHSATSSLNAGWPMSSMAGALRVRLEKPGSYALGDDIEPLSARKIYDSLRVFSVSAALTCTIFALFIIMVRIFYEAYFV